MGLVTQMDIRNDHGSSEGFLKTDDHDNSGTRHNRWVFIPLNSRLWHTYG